MMTEDNQYLVSIFNFKGNIMKKLILAAAVAGVFAGGVAHAQEATPEHSFTGNVAVTSDYYFRGVSQTNGKPALQGGFDYEHSSGFYVGNWNSNVSATDFFPGASLEMDLYGGYKFEVAPDFNLDVGVLRYYYPGVTTTPSANTTEAYIAASYKWFSAKYSRTLTNLFAYEDSKGSEYLDLGASFEIAEKTNLNLHVGHQKVKNTSDDNYTDYLVGVERDFGFATLGLAVVGNDIDDKYMGSNKKIAGTKAILTLSKSF